MLSLDAEDLDIQEREALEFTYRVTVKRRYWDIETQSYKIESTGTVLDREDIAGIGDTSDGLDRSNINEFKSGNVTLVLENHDNRWDKVENNPKGFFEADSTARKGYQRKLTEFLIEAAYIQDDGTVGTFFIIFRGHASIWARRPSDKTIQVTLETRHILLDLGDAENVSNDSGGEINLVGTVDGVNDEFTTTHNAVGRFFVIRSGGRPLREKSDYTLSNMDDPDLPATITFVIPPSLTPTAHYIYWDTLQNIEDLVSDVAVEAGIPLGEQDITAVTFPNRAIRLALFTSKDDFDGGLTVQNIDTVSTPGQFKRLWELIDDFSDGDFTSDPVWTHVDGGGSSGEFTPSVLSNQLRCEESGEGRGTIRTAEVRNTGTYHFNAQLASWINPGSGIADDRDGIAVVFFALTSTFASAKVKGYGIKYNMRGETIKFVRWDDETLEGGTILATLQNILDLVDRNWRIIRKDGGEFEIYSDKTLVASVTDDTYTENEFFLIAGWGNSLDGLMVLYTDDIYYSADTVPTNNDVDDDSIWESDPIDGLPDLGGWLNVETTDTTPSGTSLVVETATADTSGGAYDAYVPVDVGGQIRSAKKRFLKVRVTLSIPSPDTESPTVFDVSVTYATLQAKIAVANFKNMTCLTAIRELGKIANYEWGFSRAGRFFFRPRDFDETVDLEIGLRSYGDFDTITDGAERVFNKISAKGGDVEVLIDPEIMGDSRPHSIDDHGIRPLSISSNQLLIEKDVDIMSGLALAYLEIFKKEREVYQVTAYFRPQAEIGDTVRLLIGDQMPKKPWYIGDTAAYIGNRDLQLFGSTQAGAHRILTRTMNVRHSLTNKTTTFQLERILT